MWHDKKNSPSYRANVAMFKGLGGAMLLVFATYVLANVSIVPPSWWPEYVGTSEELLEKFDLTVLRRDDMSPEAHIPLKRVWKWNDSIRIHIANDKAEAERDYLTELANLLSRLTGLPISLDEGKRTISVRVVAQEEYHSKSFEITGVPVPSFRRRHGGVWTLRRRRPDLQRPRDHHAHPRQRSGQASSLDGNHPMSGPGEGISVI